MAAAGGGLTVTTNYVVQVSLKNQKVLGELATRLQTLKDLGGSSTFKLKVNRSELDAALSDLKSATTAGKGGRRRAAARPTEEEAPAPKGGVRGRAGTYTMEVPQKFVSAINGLAAAVDRLASSSSLRGQGTTGGIDRVFSTFARGMTMGLSGAGQPVARRGRAATGASAEAVVLDGKAAELDKQAQVLKSRVAGFGAARKRWDAIVTSAQSQIEGLQAKHRPAFEKFLKSKASPYDVEDFYAEGKPGEYDLDKVNSAFAKFVGETAPADRANWARQATRIAAVTARRSGANQRQKGLEDAAKAGVREAARARKAAQAAKGTTTKATQEINAGLAGLEKEELELATEGVKLGAALRTLLSGGGPPGAGGARAARAAAQAAADVDRAVPPPATAAPAAGASATSAITGLVGPLNISPGNKTWEQGQDAQMLTMRSVAKILGVARSQMAQWLRGGLIRGAVKLKGGEFRVPLGAAREWVRRMAADQASAMLPVNEQRGRVQLDKAQQDLLDDVRTDIKEKFAGEQRPLSRRTLREETLKALQSGTYGQAGSTLAALMTRGRRPRVEGALTADQRIQQQEAELRKRTRDWFKQMTPNQETAVRERALPVIEELMSLYTGESLPSTRLLAKSERLGRFAAINEGRAQRLLETRKQKFVPGTLTKQQVQELTDQRLAAQKSLNAPELQALQRRSELASARLLDAGRTLTQHDVKALGADGTSLAQEVVAAEAAYAESRRALSVAAEPGRSVGATRAMNLRRLRLARSDARRRMEDARRTASPAYRIALENTLRAAEAEHAESTGALGKAREPLEKIISETTASLAAGAGRHVDVDGGAAAAEAARYRLRAEAQRSAARKMERQARALVGGREPDAQMQVVLDKIRELEAAMPDFGEPGKGGKFLSYLRSVANTLQSRISRNQRRRAGTDTAEQQMELAGRGLAFLSTGKGNAVALAEAARSWTNQRLAQKMIGAGTSTFEATTFAHVPGADEMTRRAQLEAEKLPRIRRMVAGDPGNQEVFRENFRRLFTSLGLKDAGGAPLSWEQALGGRTREAERIRRMPPVRGALRRAGALTRSEMQRRISRRLAAEVESDLDNLAGRTGDPTRPGWGAENGMEVLGKKGVVDLLRNVFATKYQKALSKYKVHTPERQAQARQTAIAGMREMLATTQGKMALRLLSPTGDVVLGSLERTGFSEGVRTVLGQKMGEGGTVMDAGAMRTLLAGTGVLDAERMRGATPQKKALRTARGIRKTEVLRQLALEGLASSEDKAAHAKAVADWEANGRVWARPVLGGSGVVGGQALVHAAFGEALQKRLADVMDWSQQYQKRVKSGAPNVGEAAQRMEQLLGSDVLGKLISDTYLKGQYGGVSPAGTEADLAAITALRRRLGPVRGGLSKQLGAAGKVGRARPERTAQHPEASLQSLGQLFGFELTGGSWQGMGQEMDDYARALREYDASGQQGPLPVPPKGMADRVRQAVSKNAVINRMIQKIAGKGGASTLLFGRAPGAGKDVYGGDKRDFPRPFDDQEMKSLLTDPDMFIERYGSESELIDRAMETLMRGGKYQATGARPGWRKVQKAEGRGGLPLGPLASVFEYYQQVTGKAVSPALAQALGIAEPAAGGPLPPMGKGLALPSIPGVLDPLAAARETMRRLSGPVPLPGESPVMAAIRFAKQTGDVGGAARFMRQTLSGAQLPPAGPPGGPAAPAGPPHGPWDALLAAMVALTGAVTGLTGTVQGLAAVMASWAGGGGKKGAGKGAGKGKGKGEEKEPEKSDEELAYEADARRGNRLKSQAYRKGLRAERRLATMEQDVNQYGVGGQQWDMLGAMASREPREEIRTGLQQQEQFWRKQAQDQIRLQQPGLGTEARQRIVGRLRSRSQEMYGSEAYLARIVAREAAEQDPKGVLGMGKVAAQGERVERWSRLRQSITARYAAGLRGEQPEAGFGAMEGRAGVGPAAPGEGSMARTRASLDKVSDAHDRQGAAFRRNMRYMQDQMDTEEKRIPILERLGIAIRRLAYYTGAAMFLYSLVAMFRMAAMEAMNFEVALARLQGIFQSKALVDRLVVGRGIMGVAREYGVPLDQATQLAQTFAQAGYGPKESIGMTRAASAAMRGAGIEPGQAAELLIAVRQLTNGQVQAMDIIDRISRVESTRAVSAQDLAVAIQRTGSLGQLLQPKPVGNLDFLNLIIGATTAIVERTRVTGNQAATGLRMIMARLAQPGVMSKLQTRFQIPLAEAGSGGRTLRPLSDILGSLSERYRTLQSGGRTQEAQSLLVTLAGARQANIGAALLQGWPQALEAAEEAALALGDTQQRVNIQMATFQAQLEKTKTALVAFASTVTQGGIGGIGKLLLLLTRTLLNIGAISPALAILAGTGVFAGLAKTFQFLGTRRVLVGLAESARTQRGGPTMPGVMSNTFGAAVSGASVRSLTGGLASPIVSLGKMLPSALAAAFGPLMLVALTTGAVEIGGKIWDAYRAHRERYYGSDLDTKRVLESDIGKQYEGTAAAYRTKGGRSYTGAGLRNAVLEAAQMTRVEVSRTGSLAEPQGWGPYGFRKVDSGAANRILDTMASQLRDKGVDIGEAYTDPTARRAATTELMRTTYRLSVQGGLNVSRDLQQDLARELDDTRDTFSKLGKNMSLGVTRGRRFDEREAAGSEGPDYWNKVYKLKPFGALAQPLAGLQIQTLEGSVNLVARAMNMAAESGQGLGDTLDQLIIQNLELTGEEARRLAQMRETVRTQQPGPPTEAALESRTLEMARGAGEEEIVRKLENQNRASSALSNRFMGLFHALRRREQAETGTRGLLDDSGHGRSGTKTFEMMMGLAAGSMRRYIESLKETTPAIRALGAMLRLLEDPQSRAAEISKMASRAAMTTIQDRAVQTVVQYMTATYGAVATGQQLAVSGIPYDVPRARYEATTGALTTWAGLPTSVLGDFILKAAKFSTTTMAALESIDLEEVRSGNLAAQPPGLQDAIRNAALSTAAGDEPLDPETFMKAIHELEMLRRAFTELRTMPDVFGRLREKAPETAALMDMFLKVGMTTGKIMDLLRTVLPEAEVTPPGVAMPLRRAGMYIPSLTLTQALEQARLPQGTTREVIPPAYQNLSAPALETMRRKGLLQQTILDLGPQPLPQTSFLEDSFRRAERRPRPSPMAGWEGGAAEGGAARSAMQTYDQVLAAFRNMNDEQYGILMRAEDLKVSAQAHGAAARVAVYELRQMQDVYTQINAANDQLIEGTNAISSRYAHQVEQARQSLELRQREAAITAQVGQAQIFWDTKWQAIREKGVTRVQTGQPELAGAPELSPWETAANLRWKAASAADKLRIEAEAADRMVRGSREYQQQLRIIEIARREAVSTARAETSARELLAAAQASQARNALEYNVELERQKIIQEGITGEIQAQADTGARMAELWRAPGQSAVIRYQAIRATTREELNALEVERGLFETKARKDLMNAPEYTRLMGQPRGPGAEDTAGVWLDEATRATMSDWERQAVNRRARIRAKESQDLSRLSREFNYNAASRFLEIELERQKIAQEATTTEIQARADTGAQMAELQRAPVRAVMIRYQAIRATARAELNALEVERGLFETTARRALMTAPEYTERVGRPRGPDDVDTAGVWLDEATRQKLDSWNVQTANQRARILAKEGQDVNRLSREFASSAASSFVQRLDKGVQDITSGLQQALGDPMAFLKGGKGARVAVVSQILDAVRSGMGNFWSDILSEGLFGQNGVIGKQMREIFWSGAMLESDMIYSAHVRGIVEGYVRTGQMNPAQAQEAYLKSGLDATGGAIQPKITWGQVGKAAMPLAGMWAGTALGQGIGRSNGYTQTWADVGASGGAAVGNLIAPGIGGFIGGALGGALGGLIGRERKPDPDYQTLDKIERNTAATVTAIENQTRDLLNLDNRLLNVPSTFVVPGYRPMGVGGGANVVLTQQVSINIHDARDPDAVARSVMTALSAEARRSGSFVSVR